MTCSACTGLRYPLTTFCGLCGGRVVAHDPLLGTTLDERFVIESKIAAGGFGSIYRAHSLDGKQVAIKVLHEQHNADPSVSARFRREAVAMSSLCNPHTVTTFELGEANGVRFIVMELLHGESLADRFTACGALHWRVVLSIVRQICDSLAEAHKLGIVHRDLKPANIFLCQEPARDFVKVLDFGIAKIVHGSNMHDGADLTRIGQAIGTLEYMSPEQLVGAALDARTDIYTLGVVAYEMISGRRPFGDVTGATGLMTALMTRKPAPVSTVARGSAELTSRDQPSFGTRTPLPPALDGVLLRCLERDACDRYDDIRELAAAIDAMLAAKGDLNTTQRQWGNKSEPVIPIMFDAEQDDEITWIDSKPPFDSKPPVDELGATAHASQPVSTPRFDEDAVRSQVVEAQATGAKEALSPRMWAARGTGVEIEPSPFDLSDSAIDVVAHVPTGAKPLIASRYQIETEPTADAALAYDAPARFPVGSSPVIAEAEAMFPRAPTRTGLGFLRVVLWAVGLTAVGLGIGMAVAAIAS